MIVPDMISEMAAIDLQAALEAVDAGGPYPERLRRIIQLLHVYGFARVTTYHHPPVNGLSLVEIRSAELTDRGVSLLREILGLDDE